jgi:3-hydroxy-5-methyl-1-naphthoate 3-O-methyltransferase
MSAPHASTVSTPPGSRTGPVGHELGLPGLLDLALGFQRAQVLFTAAELEVFGILAGGAKSAAEVATELDAEPRGIEALLDACVALRILRRGPAGYENSGTTRVFLLRDGGPSFSGALRLWKRFGYDAWGRLATVLKDAGPQFTEGADLFEQLEGDPERLRLFSEGLGSLAYWPAQKLATVVDFSSRRHLLDLGGGSGVYAAAIADRYPQLRVTLFDRPRVCALALQRFRRLEREGRFGAIPGNFFQDPLPEGCDAVLLSHVLHDWSPEECTRLLGKVQASLPEGGEVVVHDFMPTERGVAPEASLFALTLVLDTPHGRVYTLSEMREWLEGVGFRRVQHQTVAGGTSVLTGRKER